MALTDESIAEKKARNESNRDRIAELKLEIARAEQSQNNEVRGTDLDREAEAQEREIARLQNIASGINAGGAPAAEKPKNKPVIGDQRTPTNFGGNAAAAEGKE